MEAGGGRERTEPRSEPRLAPQKTRRRAIQGLPGWTSMDRYDKRNMKRTLLALFAAGLCAAQTGVFESHADIGVTPKSGDATFNAGEYRVTGGGANVWDKADAFHFVYKKLSGDVTITADVKFFGTGAVAHRKAMLMIRQSLDPGSPYADIALHGDGLTSLQYRTSAGAVTQEMRSDLSGVSHLRIERRGDTLMIYAGDELWPGGPVTVRLGDPVYVGLGICSHDANVLETAVFSGLKIDNGPRTTLQTLVHVYDVKTRKDKVIYQAKGHFEAPNWSPDGKYLLMNADGSLYRMPPEGGAPVKMEIPGVANCNNDHGITRDGKMLALSCRGPAGNSQVYLANADGSGARLMTPKTPSYFHGFSPDGKWFAYAAQRDGNFDIYRMPVDGGEEQRLTHDKGLDDGPDYSPDGKWLYFHSERANGYDAWRMPPDGAGANDEKAQRITSDDLEDWFPHPSPDGKRLLVVSFAHGTKGHPANRNVEIRMLPAPKDKIKPVKPVTLVKLFGGQGTINVNSWAPDSRRFAYISYEYVPE